MIETKIRNLNMNKQGNFTESEFLGFSCYRLNSSTLSFRVNLLEVFLI